MPPHEPGILRASEGRHHDLGLGDDVGRLGSVPDVVPLSFAAVLDARRVDDLGVVGRNTARRNVTPYRVKKRSIL